eukprot:scaffold4784_cov229-Alexandrium_tamarense.AAC.9
MRRTVNARNARAKNRSTMSTVKFFQQNASMTSGYVEHWTVQQEISATHLPDTALHQELYRQGGDTQDTASPPNTAQGNQDSDHGKEGDSDSGAAVEADRGNQDSDQGDEGDSDSDAADLSDHGSQEREESQSEETESEKDKKSLTMKTRKSRLTRNQTTRPQEVQWQCA